jgi:hypothetical protein
MSTVKKTAAVRAAKKQSAPKELSTRPKKAESVRVLNISQIS